MASVQRSLKGFFKGYWPLILLPGTLLALLWLVAYFTAQTGDAPGSYAIM